MEEIPMTQRRPSTFIQPEMLESYLEYLMETGKKPDEFVTLSVHQVSSLITAYLELLHKQKK
jgi:gluconate kinase